MKIIECPRDAMQGIVPFISTADKVRYLNQLLKVGFDTLDAGSFVSAKAIPQLRDTAEVFDQVDWQASSTGILAIAANLRGGEQAVLHPAVRYVGFPLSLSETFQQRNTNRSIAEALDTVNDLQELCTRTDRKLVVYLSMGFGNPYGDPYDVSLVGSFVDILRTLSVGIISVADTIGVATPEQIASLFTSLTLGFPSVELGVHLHSHPAKAKEKIEAAYDAGCRRFDGALKGFGGCPMAEDELVGNLATETIVDFMDSRSVELNLNREAMRLALAMADEVFPKH